MYRLYGNPGWGSVLVEAQLAWYGLAFETIEVGDVFTSTGRARRSLCTTQSARRRCRSLILPDGEVMTESAAITLHLADATRKRRSRAASGEAGARRLPALAHLSRRQYLSDLHLRRRSRALRCRMPRRATSYRAARRRLCAETVAHRRGSCRSAMVPGRTVFGPRYLCVRR